MKSQVKIKRMHIAFTACLVCSLIAVINEANSPAKNSSMFFYLLLFTVHYLCLKLSPRCFDFFDGTLFEVSLHVVAASVVFVLWLCLFCGAPKGFSDFQNGESLLVCRHL